MLKQQRIKETNVEHRCWDEILGATEFALDGGHGGK